jgi:hypothetical protein
MGAQGSGVLDFGAFPGGSDASLVITGQSGIASGSLVEAYILPADTADHLADEHLVESIRVFAGKIVAGTGFTIFGRNDSQINETPLGIVGDGRNAGAGKGTRIYGKWNVAWVWN